MQVLQTADKVSFKNILFLTDFTEASAAAQAYAVGLARHYGAQLYPAHACNPIVLTETAGTDIIQEVEDASRERLYAQARETGLDCKPLFARGAVEEAFPGWIAEHDIDLVVMGTHGRHGLRHFLMGSVAEAVFRKASCPVLTVGPHVTTRPYHDFKVESILFPTDLGSHAEFAARYALSAAQENYADITFMHVITPEQIVQKDRDSLVNTAYWKLNKIVPAEARRWCKPQFVVEAGDPVKELTGYLERERPDLIVLGLPAEKSFNGHFNTGVTYNLIASAPCPVLTLRDAPSNN